MMVTVDGRGFAICKLTKQAALQNSHAMRMPIARRALVMIDSVWLLAGNVLNQRAAAKYIQRLNAKTNCEDRRPARFGFFERQQIGSIFLRMHASKAAMRLMAVSQRINVGIAARQKQSIDSGHDAGDV